MKELQECKKQVQALQEKLALQQAQAEKKLNEYALKIQKYEAKEAIYENTIKQLTSEKLDNIVNT